MVEVLLMLKVLFTQYPEVEVLFRNAVPCFETCLFFCNKLFCLWLQSLQYDLQHNLT